MWGFSLVSPPPLEQDGFSFTTHTHSGNNIDPILTSLITGSGECRYRTMLLPTRARIHMDPFQWEGCGCTRSSQGTALPLGSQTPWDLPVFYPTFLHTQCFRFLKQGLGHCNRFPASLDVCIHPCGCTGDVQRKECCSSLPLPVLYPSNLF